MLLSNNKITEIFYLVNKFCLSFEKAIQKHLIGNKPKRTPTRVCKNKRIKRNKVFARWAQSGKSTMGYFFGFKLNIVINDKGELLNFVITPDNTDDREPLRNKSFIQALKQTLC